MHAKAIEDFNAANDIYGRMLDQTIDWHLSEVSRLRKMRAMTIELGADVPQIEALAERFAPPAKVAR